MSVSECWQSRRGAAGEMQAGDETHLLQLCFGSPLHALHVLKLSLLIIAATHECQLFKPSKWGLMREYER